MFELHTENIILANAKPSINKARSNDKRSSSGNNRRNKDKNNRNHFSKVKNVPIGIKGLYSTDLYETKTNLNDN